MAALPSEYLSVFLSSALHALRAPLSRIYCAGQELRDSCADTLDEAGRFFVKSVCEGSEEIEEGFSALSEIARIYDSAPEIQAVDVYRLLQEVLDEARALFPLQKVAIGLRVETLQGDRDLLQRALLAYVKNALRFSSPVEDGTVEVSVIATEGGKEIIVRDNGVGFDMARLSRLFVPFSRLHRKEGLSGQGMGLALVKAVALVHGGAVGAEGIPGGGATFRLFLPDQK